MIAMTAQGQVPPQVEVHTQESSMEYGDENAEVIDSEISIDDLDRQGSAAPSGEQANLFEQEDADALSEREKNLVYLGQCDDRMGVRFAGIVSDVVPRFDEIDSFRELTDEELEDACAELSKYIGR
jgi:hypothetical protein